MSSSSHNSLQCTEANTDAKSWKPRLRISYIFVSVNCSWWTGETFKLFAENGKNTHRCSLEKLIVRVAVITAVREWCGYEKLSFTGQDSSRNPWEFSYQESKSLLLIYENKWMILTFVFGGLWMKRWKFEGDERAALVVFTVNPICAWNGLTDVFLTDFWLAEAI